MRTVVRSLAVGIAVVLGFKLFLALVAPALGLLFGVLRFALLLVVAAALGALAYAALRRAKVAGRSSGAFTHQS